MSAITTSVYECRAGVWRAEASRGGSCGASAWCEFGSEAAAHHWLVSASSLLHPREQCDAEPAPCACSAEVAALREALLKEHEARRRAEDEASEMQKNWLLLSKSSARDREYFMEWRETVVGSLTDHEIDEVRRNNALFCFATGIKWAMMARDAQEAQS